MDLSDGKSTDPDGSHSMNPSRMRELHKTWTLADDVALLKNLERFSELIINNASMTLCCMENLEDSLNDTSLKVKKVANNFQALADNQFIENRVDEEDDDVDVNREESMERSKTSHNPPISLEQAIANCSDVIENKFESLQIDSEDDKSNSNPVALIPKNVYENRRLPHLIGSDQFMNDETLGLVESVVSNEDDAKEEEEEKGENLEEEEMEFISQDKEDNYSNSERKSEAALLSSNQNEKLDSLVSSFVEKPSVPSSFENFRPEILTRHLSFEPPAFSTKPPLVPPDFVESQSSESEDAAPATSNSEESPTPSLTKGGLYKSKTFSSFKSDLANALQARSMMPPPPRSLAPKRKMSSEFASVSHSPPMGSSIVHKDETDRVKMDEDMPEPAPRQKLVPSFSTSKDDFFQVPKTEILTCYGKGRAKIKARRRPPSRKHKEISPKFDNPPDEKPNNPSSPPLTTSSLLSPATDEEDLFLLPADGIPSDLSNNNLFSSASLLSPGDAIEDKPIATIEPSTSVGNWDPFECDDSDGDLFSSDSKPAASASTFQPEPPKKREPTKEPDLFASSDEDDFLKDELFINKRFKSLNLNAVDKNIFGDDAEDSPFMSSSGLKLSDELAKAPSSDEDDLFSTKPSKTPDNKVKAMSKTPVMKDPLLFGGDFNEPK